MSEINIQVGTTSFSRADKVSFEKKVLEQVATDLQNSLDPKIDIKKQVKNISNTIGVHEKTLMRILKRENTPTYLTVFKLYGYIFKELNEIKVLDKVPQIIKAYLVNFNPQSIEKDTTYSASVDKEIQSNPVFGELYVLASTGGVRNIDVIQRFGKYGLEVLRSMLERKILSEVRTGEFVVGANQTNLTPESILSLGLQLSASYAKPENGYELSQNFLSFYAEMLTEETYQQWLQIDSDAYYKKLELLKNQKTIGSKRIFTFAITDTLESGKSK